jgi:hypothetical protein
MRHLFIFFIVLILTAPALAEPPKTVIEDQAEADLLLGRHIFTKWYLDNNALTSEKLLLGEAYISEKNGHYFLDANHECYWRAPRYPKSANGGYVKAKGDILNIADHKFSMRGHISVMHIPFTGAGGRNTFRCDVDGIFTFLRDESGEEFSDPLVWRLVVEYDLTKKSDLAMEKRQCLIDAGPIDITVEQLEGEAPHPGCVRNFKDFHTLPMP